MPPSWSSTPCLRKVLGPPLQTTKSTVTYSSISFPLLPSATKLRRLCFYTCLSFCSQGGLPQCMLGYHPPSRPPRTRPPPGPDTPPSRRLLLRTVRILLKCILVVDTFNFRLVLIAGVVNDDPVDHFHHLSDEDDCDAAPEVERGSDRRPDTGQRVLRGHHELLYKFFFPFDSNLH